VGDTVVVFSGGPRPGAHVLAALPPGASIIGADRGAAHALSLGLRVELAVGDFDSIGRAALEELERSGARLERHHAAKDATDLELALDAAAALGPRRILVVGGASGRLDHLLGGLLALGAEAYAGVEVDALLGRASVHVIRGERRLRGSARELISLFAVHAEARGVVSEGLAYPLRGEVLAPGSSRGVSNLFEADEARVTLESGVVVAVRPGTRASPAAVRIARGSVREGTSSS
jgi:thiamine pyrophosphokinase